MAITDADDQMDGASLGRDALGGLGVRGEVPGAGRLFEQAAAVQEKIEEAAELVQERYRETRERADEVVAEVTNYVREKPWVALGIAAVVGYIVGMHVAGGGKRVIYLKDGR